MTMNRIYQILHRPGRTKEEVVQEVVINSNSFIGEAEA